MKFIFPGIRQQSEHAENGDPEKKVAHLHNTVSHQPVNEFIFPAPSLFFRVQIKRIIV